MKTYSFFFIPLFIFVACTSVGNDMVEVSSCDTFSDESAGDPVHLTAKIYNDTVSCYPVRIALCDTLLFAVNSGSAGDALVTCFNVSDARYRGLVYSRGNGPSELLSAGNIGLSADSLSFWVFDTTKQTWAGRRCDDPDFSSPAGRERCRMINLRDTLVLGKMNPVWLKESYAATSLFHYEERFFICDTLSGKFRPVNNPNLKFHSLYETPVMGDIFSTQMCVTPDRSTIILAGRYMDWLEIYNADGTLRRMVKGPRKSLDFKFDVERSIKNGSLVKSPDSRRAYLAVKATEKYIYALYSGKTKEDQEHYSYSRHLYVFSLDGDILRKYELDTPVIDIAIDECRKRIYAVSIDVQLVYFDME